MHLTSLACLSGFQDQIYYLLLYTFTPHYNIGLNYLVPKATMPCLIPSYPGITHHSYSTKNCTKSQRRKEKPSKVLDLDNKATYYVILCAPKENPRAGLS